MIDGMVYVGAGLAVSLAGMGVGIAEGLLAKKTIDVMAKNPDIGANVRNQAILGLALVESAAIYGLIVALILLFGPDVSGSVAVGAGLSVGLAGFGVALGEGMLVSSTIEGMLRNPHADGQLKQSMILLLALVESAAIYGLIVALIMIFSS